jgi:hypothetical protein
MESQGFSFQNQNKYLTFIKDARSGEEIPVTACDVVNNELIFFRGDEEKKRICLTGVLSCTKTSDEEILIQERFAFPKIRKPRDLVRVTSIGFSQDQIARFNEWLQDPNEITSAAGARQRTQ